MPRPEPKAEKCSLEFLHWFRVVEVYKFATSSLLLWKPFHMNKYLDCSGQQAHLEFCLQRPKAAVARRTSNSKPLFSWVLPAKDIWSPDIFLEDLWKNHLTRKMSCYGSGVRRRRAAGSVACRLQWEGKQGRNRKDRIIFLIWKKTIYYSDVISSWNRGVPEVMVSKL